MNKSVEATALADALGLIPEGHRVVTNPIGNMAILDADYDYVGYIDFGNDCKVTWLDAE